MDDFDNDDDMRCCVEHNLSHAQPRWAFPPLITHSRIVNFDRSCCHTAEEHLLAQGELAPCLQVEGEVPVEWQTCLRGLIATLNKSRAGRHELRPVAGNGMSMQNLVAFET